MSPDQNIFLEQLYHENFQYLKGYAFHLINNWDKAEVAVQEAFCIAIEKIDEVMSSDAPLRWMKATVKNTVRNMKKHESYQRSLFVYLEELESLPSTSEALKWYRHLGTVQTNCRGRELPAFRTNCVEWSFVFGSGKRMGHERMGLSQARAKNNADAS